MSVQALLGKKIGTTQYFDQTGRAVCVTALEVGPCTVTQVKSVERDGYSSAQIGFEEVKKRTQPLDGHLKPSGGLFRHLREVDIDDGGEVEVGQKLDVGLFEPGQKVDATGNSKGRGFAGGVKRHNFRGGPKTHGQSDRHRAPGSIGAGSTPGRVIKGLKMAGHMGNARVTVRNLKVVEADSDRNLLLLEGAVPGAHNSIVMIRKTG
jgi:large subunit ribosomal protein L3